MSDELNEKMIKAAINGEAEEVNRLIDEGADPNATTKDSNGFTALHWAVLGCHLKTVEVLLRRKADPNATADNGWTPLVALNMQLPKCREESTEKYNECVKIERMLNMAGAKE